MAGYLFLNILLLWAGIVTLASSSSTSPALTTHASTVTPANVTLSVAPQSSTQTPSDLPLIIPAAATVSPTPTKSPTIPVSMTISGTVTGISAQPSNASTDSLQATNCSYTLVPILYGFRINIENFLSGQNYNLTLEDEMDGTRESRLVKNTIFDIVGLKPCTDYRHNLSHIHGYCEHSGSGNVTKPIATTQSLSKKDLVNAQPNGEQVCYESKWNIQNDQNRNPFCIKYSTADICTNVTGNFSACNSSFTLDSFVDFDSNDIKVPMDRYPINIKLPPNCKNWTKELNCSEKGEQNKMKKSRSELEPYTPYECTVEVTRENVVKRRDLNFSIDCDLKLKKTKVIITNTSVELGWNLTSSVCQGNLPEFNFVCRYNKSHEGDSVESKEPSCMLTELKVFTTYICQVVVKYKSKQITFSNHTFTTDPGKPEKPHIISLQLKGRNSIRVSYTTDKNVFNGPQKIYIVKLCRGEAIIMTENITGNHRKYVEFEDLDYSTNYIVKLTIFNGVLESDPASESISTSYNEKPLIGFLVFLIILTSLALLFVTYKIYILRRERSRDSSESMILIPKTNDEDRLIFVEPITVESLLDAYKRKIADEGRLFLAEFQTIPRIFSKYTVKEAKKTHNVPKNRYVDILPYDYNRVQLTTGNGSAGCDYINASFIDGFKESKKYIAAQGPKDETVGDFWRMIWEQQTSIIVMVSRCEEGNRVKCAQYWPSPDRDTEIFEEFIVKLVLEDYYPNYTIRHLSLTNKRDKGSEREVTHIQFMSWPDHGVPEEAHLLLKLRRQVNSFKNLFSGPIVIHCSAGVGRTGTYIGIDAMMESLEAEGRVDIYGYVVMLRRQRCLMVQVEAQYILIHQALLEHSQFGETELSLQELHSTLNTLKQRSSDNDSTLMEDEFDRLPNFKNWKTFNTGIAEENKKKNRTASVIPYDYNRVLLKVDEGRSHESDPDNDYEMSSDDDNEDTAKYINASLISGYWNPHNFLVAQTPLPDTVADFWTMILQYKVPAVVMLSDCSHTDEDCLYWGEEKKTFEDIEVNLESTENCPNFTLRNMLIHHVTMKVSQQVKHFQFLKWGNRELPEKPQDLVDLIKEITRRCGLTWPRNTPIVIHCTDGSSRSGVLCGLWNLLDSARNETTVDVFQVVKTLRKERQRMFSSLEQYQFLYDALEVIFPVQNGDVKAAQNSVQIVNETQAAEKPCSTTSTNQQEAEKSAAGDVSAATEEDSNCPTDTVEV